MSNRVFIAWRRYQRRTELLAAALNAQCIWESRRSSSRLFRVADYGANAARDFRMLRQRKPRSVIVQAPPHLPALVPRVLQLPYAIDAHNAMMQGWWRRLPTVRRTMNSAAVVVTHTEEADMIAREEFPDARTLVVRDPLRVVPSAPCDGRIMIVASASADEPMDLIARTVGEMPHREFITTAPVSRLPTPLRDRFRSLPNLQLLPFQTPDAYDCLVASSAALLVLTTRAATQPSGACEALGAAVPLVVSRTDTTTRLFGCWSALVEHTVEDLMAGIERAVATSDRTPIRTAREEWLRASVDEVRELDRVLASVER